MKLNRKSLLLLAAAVLLAGVGLWYAFLRNKAVPPSAGSQPATGTGTQPGGSSVPTDTNTGGVPGPVADDVLFTPGVDDDPDNPVRITVTTNWDQHAGKVRVGSDTDQGMLSLTLHGNLRGRKGQVRNVANPQASPGNVIKYLVDNVLPWRDSIDTLWFGTDWPHVIECWEVDPNQPVYNWRVNGLRHGQTVFTLITVPNVYEY